MTASTTTQSPKIKLAIPFVVKNARLTLLKSSALTSVCWYASIMTKTAVPSQVNQSKTAVWVNKYPAAMIKPAQRICSTEESRKAFSLPN